MDPAREDESAAGMVDAHQLLHHLGGRRDLEPGDRAEVGLEQGRERRLRRIGLGERRRRNRGRQVAIGGARAMGVADVARRGVRIEHGGYRTNLYLKRAPSGSISPVVGCGKWIGSTSLPVPALAPRNFRRDCAACFWSQSKIVDQSGSRTCSA